VPLREYAESHQLSARHRLELMAKVCDAVEHAHQRGIIHRDLKPGNILVDETGQPKILDFGVAHVTNSDEQATRQTDVGQLIGTLAYMSPEQVTADPLELDTRSDVYALGVILYELLANRLPYQLSHQLPEAVRAIREEDPTKLSSISRAYRGDVETIVAKALEKDKGRRYSAAAVLATDIRRYLADEPIMARPPTTTYQLRKFARRHKALVTATAAVFAVLVAGVIVSTREAVRARRAEQTAQAVNDFLQNDLLAQASASTQASPSTKPDPDLKVRTALDRAAARIGGKFRVQTEVEAAIRDTIGQAYSDLGLYPQAQAQWERALELYGQVLGATDLKTKQN
jgi:serine/threonine protein kinase